MGLLAVMTSLSKGIVTTMEALLDCMDLEDQDGLFELGWWYTFSLFCIFKLAWRCCTTLCLFFLSMKRSLILQLKKRSDLMFATSIFIWSYLKLQYFRAVFTIFHFYWLRYFICVCVFQLCFVLPHPVHPMLSPYLPPFVAFSWNLALLFQLLLKYVPLPLNLDMLLIIIFKCQNMPQ